MNGVELGRFSAAFSDWVRASWPDKTELVAIDGKTSRRSCDRSAQTPPLQLVSAFAEAGERLETHLDIDNGHGRIAQRRMSALRESDWINGDRRFPGEPRLPGAACLLRAETCVESRGVATASHARSA